MTMPNDTREKLEIQALHFFAEHDYERSSLNDIAEALGVTKGAIYHYFPSKDELFKASVSRLLDMMAGVFGDSLPADVPLRPLLEGLFNMEQALEEIGSTSGLGDFVTAYENSFYLFLAALKKFPDLQEQLDRIYHTFIESLEAILKASIEHGEVRADIDVPAVAYEITAFYEGALLLGAFTSRRDYLTMGPRVCATILDRIEVPGAAAKGTWEPPFVTAHREAVAPPGNSGMHDRKSRADGRRASGGQPKKDKTGESRGGKK